MTVACQIQGVPQGRDNQPGNFGRGASPSASVASIDRPHLNAYGREMTLWEPPGPADTEFYLVGSDITMAHLSARYPVATFSTLVSLINPMPRASNEQSITA